MPLPPMVGRTRETADLRREFEAARHRPGRVVIVSGDPGVGKTRLLQEFAHTVRSHAIVLTGHGSPLGATVPYGIFLEPLEAHLSRPLADAGAMSVRQALVELARDRPVVLVLDDLHEADRSSWDLVAYLGRQPPPAPVLVVATCRIAQLIESEDLAGTVGALLYDRLAAEIRLDAFAPAEVTELATAILGAAPDPAVAAVLFERAGGNPLFTTALLDQLTADGSLAVVPDSVRERVARIRAALPDPVRQALDVAAVLGHSFAATTIAALTGPDAPSLLDRLVSERLLAERPDGYDFVHPLLREASYEALGAARRRQLHEQVGQALVAAPVGVRAYHLARGALPGDLPAVALLQAAAAETARLQAHRETLNHLTAALTLTPHSATDLRRELLGRIAGESASVADHVTGLAALHELADLETHPVRRARIRMQQASFLSTGAAEVAAAERAATEAVEMLRAADATEHLAAAVNERAWIRGMAGDFRGQADGCREALDLTGDPDVELHIIGPLGGVLGLLGDFDGARQAHQRARTLAAATNDPGQIGWHAAVAHLTDLYEGRFAAAAATLDPAVDPAPAQADIGTPWRTLTDWFFGRWELGRADSAVVREAFPVAPSAHMAWSFTMGALFATALSDRRSSTTTAAEALIRQADRVYGDRELYFFTAVHHWATGTVRWLTGDLTAAAHHLQRSADRLHATGAIGFEGLLAAERLDVLAALGELTALRQAVARAHEIAGILGTPFAAAQAAYATGLLAGAERRTSEAGEAFGAAEAGYADTPFLRARALEHRARWAPARAVEDLGEAAQLYSRLPAPGHREQVLARLRGAGAAGKRAAQQVGALTERERQIAMLAAGGLASPAIAARLHLSARTVETHLGRIYHKLGIDSRTKLAEALDRDDR